MDGGFLVGGHFGIYHAGGCVITARPYVVGLKQSLIILICKTRAKLTSLIGHFSDLYTQK